MVIEEGVEISGSSYNLILGGCVGYGLIMNAISVAFFKDFFLNINPVVFLIAYFISCIAGSIIAAKSNKPSVSFLGYNLIVLPIGGLLTISLEAYAGVDILSAMIITSGAVLIMTFLSTIKPELFLGLGQSLFVGLLVGLIGEIVAIIFGYGGNLFHWIFVLIFLAYIGYDYAKAQEYPKTVDNAIDSAIDIYLDVINLFLRILALLSDND
jgi:FtsH-binding integral membrane protein